MSRICFKIVQKKVGVSEGIDQTRWECAADC